MTSTLKSTLLLAIISLTASSAEAQNTSLTYIFPQVVDGVGTDGAVYISRFLIASNGGSSATCHILLFGIGPERLSAYESPREFLRDDHNARRGRDRRRIRAAGLFAAR